MRTRSNARSSERGFIVVMVMAAIIPIAVLAAAMTTLLGTRSRLATARLVDERLRATAEGAVFEGIARLNTTTALSNFPLAASTLQHSMDGLDNDGDGFVDESDEIGEVRVVVNWLTDGVDNDGDGLIDEDDEDVHCILVDRKRHLDHADNDGDGTIDEADENYMLTMVGISRPFVSSSGAREHRVYAYMQYSTALLPDAPGALYLGDPNADVSFNGNSFLVDGRDVDRFGNRTGVLMPGIAVEGPTNNVVDALRRNQNTLVVGQGTSPSVHEVTVPNPYGLSSSFIDDWIATYRPTTDIILSPGTYTANPQGSDGVDNDGDGSVDEADESQFGSLVEDEPKLVYAHGSLHFSGNNGGYGLLMVDGDLTITGQFRWTGIVVVKGSLRLSGGGATQKLILGASFVGADIFDENSGSLSIGGNAVIQYSRYYLNQATAFLGRYRLWGFREG